MCSRSVLEEFWDHLMRCGVRMPLESAAAFSTSRHLGLPAAHQPPQPRLVFFCCPWMETCRRALQARSCAKLMLQHILIRCILLPYVHATFAQHILAFLT